MIRPALVLLLPLLTTPALAQAPSAYLPLPAPQPQAAAPEAVGLPPATGPGPALFVLRGIRIEGATAVDPASLAPAWAEAIGRPASLGDLEAIAARVTASLRARGLVLSQAFVPPQEVGDGVAVIAIVEGSVARTAIAGGRPEQRAAAARIFAPVPQDRPLRLETLERAVLLSRDMFGGGVDTAVEPSPGVFGAADMLVAITPAAPVGFASVDNRGSRLYGPVGFATGATAWNLLRRNETLGLIAAGAADGSLGFVQGTLALPLLSLAGTPLDGAMLELEADYANGNPDLSVSGAPEAQTLTTRETNLRLGLRVPLIRTRASSLAATIGLDWQDSDSVTGFGPTEIRGTDRLFVLDAQLEWDRADRFGGVSLVSAGLRHGLDGPRAVTGDGVGSGDPGFALATLELARLQRLGIGPWALWLEAIGQAAFDVLPNAERFSLGDGSIGRGFAPGNTTGDSGFGLRVELRRQVGGASLATLAEAAELYAFGDWGRAFDRDADRDGARVETLASAGIGARIDVRPWLSVTPEIARQLRGLPTDTTDPRRETRFYLGLTVRF